MNETLLIIIVILIGLLFVRDVMVQWFRKFFGVEEKRELPEHVPDWATTLTEHFNHETTQQNQDILNELREIKEITKTNCKKTQAANDHLLEIRMNGVRIKNGSK